MARLSSYWRKHFKKIYFYLLYCDSLILYIYLDVVALMAREQCWIDSTDYQSIKRIIIKWPSFHAISKRIHERFDEVGKDRLRLTAGCGPLASKSSSSSHLPQCQTWVFRFDHSIRNTSHLSSSCKRRHVGFCPRCKDPLEHMTTDRHIPLFETGESGQETGENGPAVLLCTW